MEGKKTTKPSNLDSDDSIPNRKISPTLQMEHLIQGCKWLNLYRLEDKTISRHSPPPPVRDSYPCDSHVKPDPPGVPATQLRCCPLVRHAIMLRSIICALCYMARVSGPLLLGPSFWLDDFTVRPGHVFITRNLSLFWSSILPTNRIMWFSRFSDLSFSRHFFFTSCMNKRINSRARGFEQCF